VRLTERQRAAEDQKRKNDIRCDLSEAETVEIIDRREQAYMEELARTRQAYREAMLFGIQ